MLCFPYLTRAGTATLRFRRLDIDPENPAFGPKYRSLPGDPTRIYNVSAFARPEDFIVVCEGEIDAITAHQAGLPAVGLPGVSSWQNFFRRPFAGYGTVYILADNDIPKQRPNCSECRGLPECLGHSPGNEFAEHLAEVLPNPRVVPMPPGEDVNSFVKTNGSSALLELLKVKGDR